MSRKPEYLRTAATWIKRLDQSDTAGVNLRVYRLRYGSAKNIAGLLNEILAGKSGGLSSAQGQLAPGSSVSVSSSGGPLAALSAAAPSSTITAQAGGNGGGGGAGLASGARPQAALRAAPRRYRQ